MFRDQKQHKGHLDFIDWKCGYCRKRFYEDKYINQHFDDRHYNLLNVSRRRCLADLCGALHCHHAIAARNKHVWGSCWQLFSCWRGSFGQPARAKLVGLISFLSSVPRVVSIQIQHLERNETFLHLATTYFHPHELRKREKADFVRSSKPWRISNRWMSDIQRRSSWKRRRWLESRNRREERAVGDGEGDLVTSFLYLLDATIKMSEPNKKSLFCVQIFCLII